MDAITRLNESLAGRYLIERELGAGGMATVYLAHDLKHDRHVALKVLKPELAQSLGRDRFLREIQLAAKLSHPHILPLYDSGDAGGALFYAMPNVEGQSLRDRLKGERMLPVDEAVRITIEGGGGAPASRVKLVAHVSPDPLTVTGRTVRTAAFMSTDQTRGEPIEVRGALSSRGC